VQLKNEKLPSLIHTKWLLWIGEALLLFLCVTGLIYAVLSYQSRFTNFESQQADIKLHYPNNLQKKPLGDQDNKDKIVLRLQQPDKESELLATVRYEEGLKPIATAAKRELRDALAETVSKTYPKRFPSYHQTNAHDLDIDNHRASEIIFTYKSPRGETIKERFILVAINDDKAVYLAFQSQEKDFDRLNSRYFSPIVESLRVN
jgi:hypothetical protein